MPTRTAHQVRRLSGEPERTVKGNVMIRNISTSSIRASAVACAVAVVFFAGVPATADISCDVIRDHVDEIYSKGYLLWEEPLSYRVDYNYTGTPLTPIDRTVEAYLKVFQGYSGLEVVEEPEGASVPKFRVIVATDFVKTLETIRPTYEGPVNDGGVGKYQSLIDRAAKGHMRGHIIFVAQRGEILHTLVLINPNRMPKSQRKAFIIESVMRGLLFSKADSTAIGPSIFTPGLIKDAFYMLPAIDLELMDAMYDPPVFDRTHLANTLCVQLKAGGDQ